MEEIRKEIAAIEKSAKRLKELAADMPGIKTNADIILTFVFLLKFVTPVGGKQESLSGNRISGGTYRRPRGLLRELKSI